jgi:Flp pilus assembly CpaF family ATPase
VVGEVRDEAALDLCDAWETGHPGGGAAHLPATNILG